MKYRKKSEIVEAFRYTKEDIPEWAREAYKKGVICNLTPTEQGLLYIKPPVGTHKANIGDYIIRDTKGELYVCKPDIFEQIYEAVE